MHVINSLLEVKCTTLSNIQHVLCVHTQLDPSTVWLREQYGSHAFFPYTMNVKFDLPPDVAQVSLSLIVEGSDPAVPGTRKRVSESGNAQQVRKKRCSEAPIMIHGCPHCYDEQVRSVLKRLDNLLASIAPLISNKANQSEGEEEEEEEEFLSVSLQ